jgi:serine/threonine protein kinase
VQGRRVDDRYLVEQVLGEGSTATVYRARDERTAREVAVKFLRKDPGGIPQARARFEAEAGLLARVNSPNVVPVLDFGNFEGYPYLVMEYIEATDLGQVLEKRGNLGMAEAREMAAGVAAGLEALHEMDIVHRDLKPANILVDSSGSPRITDLGIAKASHSSSVRTRTGVLMGTPGFLAPEVLEGSRAGPEADIYALGVILYVLHTGELPFEGEDIGSIMKSQLRGVPRQTLRVLPGSSASLVAAMTQRDPRARPGLAEIRRRLAEPLALVEPAPTVMSSPLPHPDGVPPNRRGSRRRILAAGTASLVVAVGGAWLLWSRPVGGVPAPPPEILPAEELFGDLGRLSLRETLEEFLGTPASPRLQELVRSSIPVPERRHSLEGHLRRQPWYLPLEALESQLDPAWWTRAPAPGEDVEAHRLRRLQAARRLSELLQLSIFADTLGPGEPVLPDIAEMLAPVIHIRLRDDLPDRADRIPDARVLIDGCQILGSVRGGSTERFAGLMAQIFDPPSCSDGVRAPTPSVQFALEDAAPGPDQDLRIVLGYFSAIPENFMEVEVLDAAGAPLVRLPVGFGRRILFRQRTSESSRISLQPARAVELRVASVIHRGEVRSLRLRYRNFEHLLEEKALAGLIAAGMVVLPPGRP